MSSVPVVALVACVKTKGPIPAPARHLYTSPLFRASAAERVADRWFILSAQHGLLHPDQQIAPYERTLNRMSVAERAAWSQMVLEELRREVSAPAHVVVLAGVPYRGRLLGPLRDAGFSISVPMEGLRFGEQLQWLGIKTRDTGCRE